MRAKRRGESGGRPLACRTVDIYWLAGLLEGEGCFYDKDSTTVLALGMTDADVIAKASKLLRCTSKTRTEYRTSNCKPYFRIKVQGKRAVGWMMTLYSLLGTRRREQIRAALASWKSRRIMRGGKIEL